MMRLINKFYDVLPYEAPVCWALDYTAEGVLAQSLEDWTIVDIGDEPFE